MDAQAGLSKADRLRSLKRGVTVVVLAVGGLAGSVVVADERLELVGHLDLSRYEGLWYEIARLPNRFQDQCAGDVTARYELLGDGKVRVTNRCRTPGGNWSEAVGVARRNASDGREAALEVRFAPRWLSLFPFVWGDYRVMALDGEYTHALVGSRDRKFLWILARQPVLSEAAFETMVSEAQGQGFDISRLEKTVHTQ
ncbi:lipocalin family protein [Wenzhouxiangella sediminis]|uniref:Outer membrane lipoprotein Blc n=1 Tax=Wenzhouxiangella sediminis TaxID=1792836 RepID=A0A3E1KBE8_9GAMM|nr:lipocalin family protein [Wenzhouxiangella sediminis]RFF31944.1 lipocalin [Wenzhouxiangella sediminis]